MFLQKKEEKTKKNNKNLSLCHTGFCKSISKILKKLSVY